jgi:glycosyltransferase involved in cell wall biosynthesis
MQLCVVVPIFNEVASVSEFVNEWLPALRAATPDFKLLLIDANSTDGTQEIIKEAQAKNPELELIIKPLKHGPACLFGYKTAVERNSEYTLQIDSDGQCDPAYFARFWQMRDPQSMVIGLRAWRKDGILRTLISRVLEGFLFVNTGTFVGDSNCPFRLMHSSTLSKAILSIPTDFELTNVLLAFLYKRDFKLKRVPIVFRKRSAGQAKVNLKVIKNAAMRFVKEIRVFQAEATKN